MVPGLSPPKPSSATEAALAAYKSKQQLLKSKSASRATVTSLISCCAGQELMDGFPDDGQLMMNDDNCDNDSFVNPNSVESVGGSSSGGSAKKKTPMENNNSSDGFASAVKKQQQRNRFTSSPLIERDSSLVKQESGLLSLLSSGTFVEASPTRRESKNNQALPPDYRVPITMRRNQTPPTPSMVTNHSPPRSAARRKHLLQQQQSSYSPNNNRSERTQQATTTTDSPAMELSMARQSANATLSSAQYQRSRSFQHNNMAPSSSPIRNSVAQTVAAMTLESPTKKARQVDDDETESYNTNSTSSQRKRQSLQSILQPSLSIEESYSAAETLPPPTPPPLPLQPAKQSTIVAQTSSFSSTEVMASKSEHKKNIVIWKHYTKAALDSHQEGHLHHSRQSLLWDTTNSEKGGGINEELEMTYKFPRMYLQDPTELNPHELNNGVWWYNLQSGVESTLGHVRSESVKQHQLMMEQQRQQQRGSDASIGSTKSFKKSLSFGTSPKSKHKSTTTNSNGEFSPSVQPTNVWSEPHASTIKVRGPTYTQDGVKIPSGESMFAVVGVDNYIKENNKNGGGGEEECRSGTGRFRERWRSVCEEVGVESVPFLLVFNFIVPWGNFQTYLIRPDADNGPFSTQYASRPSEKAWKSFLEGDTDYRNTVLKFIPRIIAGPWMVKKMVGSTPAIIGQKLPVSYSGSVEENYLEVSLDVTQGPPFGNTIANTVVGKADVVTVDLGFVLEGQEAEGTLPEQMLGLVRLHHFNMKKAFTHVKWEEELRSRLQSCLSPGGGGGPNDDHSDIIDPSERQQQKVVLQPSPRARLPVIKLVPLGEEVSQFLDGVMSTSKGNDSTSDKITDGEHAAAVQSTATKAANIIMDQPPKLKREYQPERRGNKGWTQEEMLNDLDAKMDDQNNDATKRRNNDEDDDEMSIDYTDKDLANEEDDDNDAINNMLQEKLSSYSLDCYPYTFSPLLLFTSKNYFDRGYSNYNAVAAFFAPALKDLGKKEEHDVEDEMDDGEIMDGVHAGVAAASSTPEMNRGNNQDKSPTRSPPRKSPRNGGGGSSDNTPSNNTDTPHSGQGINMLHSVIYDRKNMTYDELFNHIVTTQSLVTCCIDAHFTAFQILNSTCLIYYDPLSPNIRVASGEGDVQNAALFLLMKCKYGDDVHVQENKNYYTGSSAGQLQRRIYQLWKKINQMTMATLDHSVRWTSLPLNLDRYLFINSSQSHGQMSTQLTGNTCYFQVYLFAVLCKVGKPFISKSRHCIDLLDADLLEQATIRISLFLLTFFLEPESRICRPLTNSNFILDFHRYEQSAYFRAFKKYLEGKGIPVPNYEAQYEGVMGYYAMVKALHGYDKFALEGATASTPNSKSLQYIQSTDGATWKLCHGDYYKYRAANLMFGCNAGAMSGMASFSEFNAWRKNQLLPFHATLQDKVEDLAKEVTRRRLTMYRDYYFMPQFEVGQQELIDIHHYTYLIDMCSLGKVPEALGQLVFDMNEELVQQIHYSTQNRNSYHKIMKTSQFVAGGKAYKHFLQHFMGVEWFGEYIGLGLSDINPKEKDINCLTQTVFYSQDLMRSQQYRQEYEFEKECVNEMARANSRRFMSMFGGRHIANRQYKAEVSIGKGYTYSKYNTLMHFLNVAQAYWTNPDVNNIQVFGKDIRTLLAITCQKIFFNPNHCGYYYYGPLELRGNYRVELDLALGSATGSAGPQVSMTSGARSDVNYMTIVDRVYEFSYLKGILTRLFESANGKRFKSDNGVLNLMMLSLQLDFGLFDEYAKLLNIPFMKDLQHEADTKELQVEIANLIYDFDRKHNADAVTRGKVEHLIFQASYNFIVNKNFDLHSNQFKLIQMLNGDPDYQEYVLLCKIYMSLCQINKSVEVDYYKIKCNGLFHIVIPQNFSKKTSDYLEQITIHHSFSESDGIMKYDDISVFDLRPHQPEINLYTIRLQSKTDVQSMVKYIEFTNVFQTLSSEEQYLIFIGDNVILVDVVGVNEMNIRINQVDASVSTIFFNEAISFIPCFKYTEGEDIILFTSRNIHFLVDKGGQFCPDYYGMKHELVDCIYSEELYSDLNDDPRFRQSKLSELVTESKVVVYFPDYLLLVSSRQQLINLLDYAVYLRNVSFFILVLFMLERTTMKLTYQEKKDKVVQITGPWKDAILYMMGNTQNNRYDNIFKKQFFDINQYKNLPLREFIDKLCENFPRYQRFVDGEYQIVPREKQKRFLERIICGEECFHFSEVGSGKTKVIMPLLCQIFLSSNKEAHEHLARGGKKKNVLVILVPEHLVPDACSQVYRHCLNLNFRQKYKIYDDILTLLHDNVQLGPECKTIFVTSFNQFKKALTYDPICKKVRPHREQILVVCDEVDDFLDRDKLVFNICCNKSNTFDQPTMDYYHETSYAAYHGKAYPSDACDSSPNPSYWKELHAKFVSIHQEIQDASKSLNKSFGIFNEKTLRHCTTSISHDIEGYKALIARPYESVNRAMPGSYYSDVERTIFLTFVILSEDISKYNELFQSERKFITFEYWKEYLAELDYDELVYGHDNLSEITEKHPQTLGGLIKFLYVIILKRMEVRDRSKSVNSVDIIFNFDCIGFTGTPFLDNYPTSDYIRHQREDDIPPCIDRSFYAYTNENLPQDEFENRFLRFQGQNSNVKVNYLSSDFMNESLKRGEMDTLGAIFSQESSSNDMMTVDGVKTAPFNVIVDLCGIFKLSTIYDVRSLILKQFGADCFHYIYHIDQIDGSDRVLCIRTQNDVAFDEEFYKYLCRTYGSKLREKIFFFVDNRNYIGKDVPYQLVFQKHFNLPLFVKSVVVAHDVEDFSKIWQAMGRSRTMNDTTFSIYKSSISGEINGELGSEPIDIKKHPLTKLLYTRNCDRKMAGNLSSIYQTLIALYNLSKNSFYYSDEIVNTFIEKMEKTIMKKVSRLEEKLAVALTDHIVPARILQHIFGDKFGRSSNKAIAENDLSVAIVNDLVRQIVRQKFEQRVPSGDIYDDYIRFLSGEQFSLMEISYTKQQQKQKQKQKAKSQDNDTMDMFDKRNQLPLVKTVADYFSSTIRMEDDVVKRMLGLPVAMPIFTLYYSGGGRQNVINVYPTVQFMYSHHINPKYITDDVRELLRAAGDPDRYYEDFLATVAAESKMEEFSSKSDSEMFHTETKLNDIRQNPQYSLVGIQPGVYIIGMKDQFNIHDMENHPLRNQMQCAIDEIGFVLFDKTNAKSVDEFGPYFIEQYILLDALSKQEVAQNVITYYCRHKDKLEKGLETYDEKRGKGFICWRFLSFDS